MSEVVLRFGKRYERFVEKRSFVGTLEVSGPGARFTKLSEVMVSIVSKQ